MNLHALWSYDIKDTGVCIHCCLQWYLKSEMTYCDKLNKYCLAFFFFLVRDSHNPFSFPVTQWIILGLNAESGLGSAVINASSTNLITNIIKGMGWHTILLLLLVLLINGLQPGSHFIASRTTLGNITVV